MSGLLDGFFSLGKNINKLQEGDTLDKAEGVISLLPELKLEMTDDELLNLKEKWEQAWENSEYKKDLQAKQKDNENYWLGIHYDQTAYLNNNRPLADNIIFESLETFLPVITKQNPEPIVESDNTEEGNAIADKVKKMIAYLADILRMKLKMKKAARFWALYQLGVAKIGWSEINNDIALNILRPQKLILDPDATVEDGEYTGKYIGEVRTETASNLILRFKDKEKEIIEEVDDKLGSDIQYTEWWTNEYVFWTMKKEVLGKIKNPHWNYPQNQTKTDDYGKQTQEEVKGQNHFPIPKMPYVFLSVFNLGKHPYDDTSLIGQNLANQDLINKRTKQIDKNADNTNGGWVISGERSGLTKDEAAQAIESARKGGGIFISAGNPNEAVSRISGEPLAPFIYNALADNRNELRNIFGTRGSTPQGTINEQTVRGKIMIKGQDADRSALIADYMEQFADMIFNWFVQMMYVYYDEPHAASVLGKEKAREYITIKNSDLNRKLLVSVKDGSLIPKDEMTKRNEAIDLAIAGLLDPITMFDRLQFPNPRESAKQLFLWKTNPYALFPDLQPPQAQGEQPNQSISFKDLPPTGKQQMAAKAGIQLDPREIVQQEMNSKPPINNVPIQKSI